MAWISRSNSGLASANLVLPKQAIAGQVGRIGRQFAFGDLLELGEKDRGRLGELFAPILHPAQLVVQLLAQAGVLGFVQPGRIRLRRLGKLLAAFVELADAEPALRGQWAVGHLDRQLPECLGRFLVLLGQQQAMTPLVVDLVGSVVVGLFPEQDRQRLGRLGVSLQGRLAQGQRVTGVEGVFRRRLGGEERGQVLGRRLELTEFLVGQRRL